MSIHMDISISSLKGTDIPSGKLHSTGNRNRIQFKAKKCASEHRMIEQFI